MCSIDGDMARDFTYVDDAVEAVVRLIARPPRPGERGLAAPHRIVNIASGRKVPLMEFIAALEQAMGCRAEKVFEAMQPGDVPETWADTRLLRAADRLHRPRSRGRRHRSFRPLA